MTHAADGVDTTVEIEDAALKRRIARIASRETAVALNRKMGESVLELVKDHLAAMSVTRHKVADRLGAPHSKFFEDAPGRTVLEGVGEKGATVTIKNTPGLSRAFHDLVIRPKRARALTIPIHRVAVHKRVADLRREGHDVFRPRGTNVLAEPSAGKKDGLRPLYVLVRKAVVPQDEGLLPTKAQIRDRMEDVAEAFFLERDL